MSKPQSSICDGTRAVIPRHHSIIEVKLITFPILTGEVRVLREGDTLPVGPKQLEALAADYALATFPSGLANIAVTSDGKHLLALRDIAPHDDVFTEDLLRRAMHR